MPNAEILAKCSARDNIEQIYLISSEAGASERIRKRGDRYYHTTKKHITDATRVEIEREISRAEYTELSKRADPGRNVIYKTRYLYEYLGQTFEIDVYPFWTDRASMELELESEDQPITFPPDIKIARELTADKRYTNSSLAIAVPNEPLYI